MDIIQNHYKKGRIALVVSAKEPLALKREGELISTGIVALNLNSVGRGGWENRKKLALGPLSVEFGAKTQNCESIWAGTL